MRNYFLDQDAEREANALIGSGEMDSGDTKRFSHTVCGDTRRRGYLSCKPHDAGTGFVDLFYCHNCGAAGARKRSAWVGRHTIGAMKKEDASAETVEKLPDDAVPITGDDVPEHIAAWARGYRVSDKALWSPSMGRIIMPVYDPDPGVLLGYQARRDPAGSTRIPKYLTVCRRDRPLRLLVAPDTFTPMHPNVVVIVEDWVSAYQFRSISSTWGAGLLGLNATAEYALWVDTQLRYATGHPPRYLIWLDNDVKKSFETGDYLARLLGALGRRVHVQTVLNEPKYHKEQVLMDTISKITGVP